MKLAAFSVSSWMANRYLFAKNKTSFISIISWLSLIGTAIGLASLIIIMSVFNGLEDLNMSLFNIYDADLTISPVRGKSVVKDTYIVQKLHQQPAIAYFYESLEENVLVKYAGEQTIGKLKGVDDRFLKNVNFKNAIIEGQAGLWVDSIPQAILGVGIQQKLLINLDNFLEPIELLYPKGNTNINQLGQGAINSAYVQPSSVFSIESSYDNYIFVPISVCQKLFEKPHKLSAIEIQLKDKNDIENVQLQLQNTWGKNYKIETRQQKHAAILRAIKIEKLFVFIALVAITCIIALNLYFAISMMIIEKKEDIQTLKTIGFTSDSIRNIFANQGFIITFWGVVFGLILGIGLSFLQQKYGFVKMGTTSSLVDYYPVRLAVMDVVFGAISIFCVGLLASFLPAQNAKKV